MTSGTLRIAFVRTRSAHSLLRDRRTFDETEALEERTAGINPASVRHLRIKAIRLGGVALKRKGRSNVAPPKTDSVLLHVAGDCRGDFRRAGAQGLEIVGR